ncbi:MAG: hypothetical protein ABIK79_17430 [Chloroflexota bacterium]|nr:hypothetical protein [Anaerolineae bacterium]
MISGKQLITNYPGILVSGGVTGGVPNGLTVAVRVGVADGLSVVVEVAVGTYPAIT